MQLPREIRAGILPLVVCCAACRDYGVDPARDGWKARPAEPFLLVLDAEDLTGLVTLSAVEIANGLRVHSWPALDPTARTIRISPNGERAVVQQRLTELVLIDLQSGLLRRSKPAPGPVRTAAFVNNTVIATMVQIPTSGIPGRDPWGGMVLFDGATGAVIDSVRTPLRDGSANDATVVVSMVTFPERYPGRVWSSQPLQQTITVFDADALTVLDQFELDFEPRALAFSGDGEELWVESGSNLVALNPVSGSISRTLRFSDTASFEFAVSGDGNTVSLGYSNGHFRRADAHSGTIETQVRLDGPVSHLTLIPGTDELLVLLSHTGDFVGNNFFVTGPGQIRRLDGRTLAELQRLHAGRFPRDIAVVATSRD